MDMALNSNARLHTLLSRSSIEVTAGGKDQIEALRDHFRKGTDVHVTFLPNDPPGMTVDMARQVRDAGFNPIPHVSARALESREALDDFLARLVGEAAVERALVIAGDRPKPRGPFSESLAVLQTGLLQAHGIRSIAVAGHPEGHPHGSVETMEKALADKVAYARANGLELDIVTQFAFEAAPVDSYIARLRSMNINAPLHIGVAGPANLMTLVRFGMRCGVGNSLRNLSKRADVLGKLAGDTPPDELLYDIVRTTGHHDAAGITGFHFYVFGGLRKTGAWLNTFMKTLSAETPI